MAQNGYNDIPSWYKFQSWFLDRVKGKAGKGIYPILTEPGKSDYEGALLDASKTMIRVRKPEHLIKMIIRIIDKEVGVKHAAALLYKEVQDVYELIDSKAPSAKEPPSGYATFTSSHPLVKFFSERKNYLINENGALYYEDISAILGNKEAHLSARVSKRELVGLIEQMKHLAAYVCVPCYFKKKLLGMLLLGPKSSGRRYRRDELRFFAMLANDAALALVNAQLIDTLQGKIREIENLYEKEHNLFVHISIALAAAVDAKDSYTHGHTERVTHYALAVATELMDMSGFAPKERFDIESLHLSALLHDIGKIGVPDIILNKRGRLNKIEREKMQKHPIIGATILYPIKELGKHVISGVRSHHEHYDGTGYPDGLSGQHISDIAKIIAIADAYDAMTSDRPYRKSPLDEDTVIREIKDKKGSQFDPLVAKAFLKAYDSGMIIGSKRNIALGNGGNSV